MAAVRVCCMSHSLVSDGGVIQGTTIGFLKGSTRSLDSGSHDAKLDAKSPRPMSHT